MVLDLKSKKDKDIFNQFIKKADVVLENFRPGTMKKLGFSMKKISELNPRVILASCSGFGQTGPWAHKPAYDMIVQGIGGIMSLTGNEGDKPVRVGTSIGDIVAGIFTVVGILSALVNRNNTKRGNHIDVSMLDCQIAILENAISRYFATGTSP